MGRWKWQRRNRRAFGRATTLAGRNNDTKAYMTRVGKRCWLLPIDVVMGDSMHLPYALR